MWTSLYEQRSLPLNAVVTKSFLLNLLPQPPEARASPVAGGPGGREDDGSLWPSPQVSCLDESRARYRPGGYQRRLAYHL
jgi:hypothetical protein